MIRATSKFLLIGIVCLSSIGAAYCSTNPFGTAQSEFSIESHIGDNSEATSQKTWSMQRFSYSQKYSLGLRDDLLFRSSLRARATFETQNDTGTEEKYYLDARELKLEYRQTFLTFSLGIQEIAWGETFGFSAVDIVNPVDYAEPLYLDFSLRKMPLTMANLQFFYSPIDLQLIFVPLPRKRMPANMLKNNLIIPVLSTSKYRWFTDAEYGAKLGTTLGELALQLLYYHHWNRNIVIEWGGSLAAPLPSLVEDTVETAGASLSWAHSAMVLRSDFAYHYGVPIASLDPFARRVLLNQTQVVLGADVTFESGLLLGCQGNIDEWSDYLPNLNNKTFAWGGARLRQNFFAERLEFEGTGLFGIKSADLWLKSSLTYNAAANLKFTAEGNILNGDKKSAYSELFKKQIRLVFKAIAAF